MIVAPLGADYDQHTVSNSVHDLSDTDLDSTIIQRASRLIVFVRSGAINITWDGTDPTTSSGHNFLAGEKFQINGNPDVRNFKMIRDGASDAVVDMTLETPDGD